MLQLELDQGRSWGPSSKRESKGQEREKHRQQHQEKGDLTVESPQKTRAM